MNSNLFHNIANVLMIVLAAGTAALLATGCVQAASGAFDCTGSWVDPRYTSIAGVGLGALKVVVNIARDGFTGLTKPQPPVEK